MRPSPGWLLAALAVLPVSIAFVQASANPKAVLVIWLNLYAIGVAGTDYVVARSGWALRMKSVVRETCSHVLLAVLLIGTIGWSIGLVAILVLAGGWRIREAYRRPA